MSAWKGIAKDVGFYRSKCLGPLAIIGYSQSVPCTHPSSPKHHLLLSAWSLPSNYFCQWFGVAAVSDLEQIINIYKQTLVSHSHPEPNANAEMRRKLKRISKNRKVAASPDFVAFTHIVNYFFPKHKSLSHCNDSAVYGYL